MGKAAYSKDIENVISSFLEEEEQDFLFDKRTGVFKFGLNLAGRVRTVNYIILVEENAYVIRAALPLAADPHDKEMLAAVGEYICRLNYGLEVGNFELDMDDGEIGFKFFVGCEDSIPSMDTVKKSVFIPALLIREYVDGIIDIIFGNSTPKEALAKCRENSEEELLSAFDDEDSEESEFDDFKSEAPEGEPN